ncbi:MAG: glycosyltransferase family 2 protein [Chloroflexi bacterium]|jgi:GT2 family glycosyltransferase|nr:glycosyltransferase family 2 protein [Chloroflexota bacterium]
MPTTCPTVYTVILNWNQPEYTLDCLASLLDSEYPALKVLVVDNGSTDGSPQLIRSRFPQVEVIENRENLGYSEGNNVGIRCALQQEADYIFLLNNDTVVDKKMLARLVEVAESDPQIGVVGPTMFYFDPADRVWGGENRIHWKKAAAERGSMGRSVSREELERQPPHPADYIDSCAVLIKREVLEKIGLMDSDYFINFDDLDLNLRARRAGYRVVYVPSALMWHKVSAAMGLASPATTYYMTRNTLLFFWRHAPGIWKFTALIQVLARSLRTISAWSIKSEYKNDIYRRKRAANLYALRDFFLGRFGKMGPDVARVCFRE